MTLIEGWRSRWHRLWSIRLALMQIAIGAFSGAWVFYDPSREYTIGLSVIMFLFGIGIGLARLTKQKAGDAPAE